MENVYKTNRKAMRERKVFFGKRAKYMYEFLGWAFKNADDWRFMNYGFAYENQADNPELLPEDEVERYCAQLYHAVASQIDLTGKKLLDVGTGRGGGSSYMHRYLNPRETVGMDFASTAVAICQKNSAGIDGLSYQQGNAMEMPFKEGEFDAVTNVESSHCYPDRAQFFREVVRVLKPGGSFLYTDFTPSGSDASEEMTLWMEELQAAGFENITSTNITRNVVKGLDADDARRVEQINTRFPFFLCRFARLWAGTKESWIYDDFANGRREYVIFHGVKPG
ncbi:MAG: class I SAM-dependent methyltransferase [Rhodobacteraceae bacterium]|nr:class I SAM-dependent methyltransferase [Paracoccaceae bacterium]